MKPKNSNSLNFFASFDTLLDPRCAKVVEINFTSKIALFEMILRANTPVCIFSQVNLLFLETLGTPLSAHCYCLPLHWAKNGQGHLDRDVSCSTITKLGCFITVWQITSSHLNTVFCKSKW